VYSAQELGVPITVVVPESTPLFIVEKMREEGATVEIVGQVSCSSALPDGTPPVNPCILHLIPSVSDPLCI
jgi:hypothetical protein